MKSEKKAKKAKAEKKPTLQLTAVLLSHARSGTYRDLQTVDLKQHLAARGVAIEDVKVEYADKGEGVHEWIRQNPGGAVFRNRYLQPCSEIQLPKSNLRSARRTKATPKTIKTKEANSNDNRQAGNEAEG